MIRLIELVGINIRKRYLNMAIIGAYLSSKVFNNWTLAEAKTALNQLQTYGINTIFSEADSYRDEMIDLVHEMGMPFMGGLTCFQNNDVLQSQPELHPITHHGQPRPQMKWYIGITPSYETYAQSRLDALEEMLMNHNLDGIWLDFIRWALHWEQELRDDTPPPLESSFDLHTLKRFAKYADLDIPSGTTSEQTEWILTRHRDTWIDFKCSVITDFVNRAKQITQTHANGKPLGLDIVPAKSTIREHLLGQRLPDLADSADYLSPMLYHHIQGKSPSWITDILDSFADETSTQLLPFIQADSLGIGDSEQGFSTKEWEKVLSVTLDHPNTVGLIVFTGDRLSKFRRGDSLRQILA